MVVFFNEYGEIVPSLLHCQKIIILLLNKPIVIVIRRRVVHSYVGSYVKYAVVITVAIIFYYLKAILRTTV